VTRVRILKEVQEPSCRRSARPPMSRPTSKMPVLANPTFAQAPALQSAKLDLLWFFLMAKLIFGRKPYFTLTSAPMAKAAARGRLSAPETGEKNIPLSVFTSAGSGFDEIGDLAQPGVRAKLADPTEGKARDWEGMERGTHRNHSCEWR
jgi:hypothetical protein